MLRRFPPGADDLRKHAGRHHAALVPRVVDFVVQVLHKAPHGVLGGVVDAHVAERGVSRPGREAHDVAATPGVHSRQEGRRGLF